MNLKKKHFVALEFLIDDGKINIYDCNLSIYTEDEFFLFIVSMLELFPRLLK
ncbi:hypothetical protein R3W88_029152 [Solanum pinnatisectum]|uniref:Uncharacterized protein n=1 Tax=Solanum pinnatisectum TaxID=50273 RepID=A0AAV9K4Q7_9SOLN|nr:hypothetical protein R3W88_029152 [Solanum pinnatisectum]